MSMFGCFPVMSLLPGGFVNKEALWKPPEISGWLEQKEVGARNQWRRRFFVLKGSYLFYFLQSTSRAPKGMIPMEYALLEASEESRDLEKLRYTILIKMHKAYEDYCTHCAYKLASGKQEIREAWFAALSHAVLPPRVLVRELQSCGRLEALLSDKEQLHRTHKSKISFFRPGRLVNDDVASHASENYSITSSKPPDPLNTRGSLPPPLDPERTAHEREVQPRRGSEVEGLQEMVEKQSTDLNFEMTKRDSNLHVLRLLQPSSSAEQISSYHPTQVPADSTSIDTWVSHDNPLGYASLPSDQSEVVDTYQTQHSRAGSPPRSSYSNQSESRRRRERKQSFGHPTGRTTPTVHVSTSITEPAPGELDEISVRDPPETPRQSISARSTQPRDFPGFAPRASQTQRQSQKAASALRGAPNEAAHEERLFLSRSATDDPRSETTRKLELQPQKRQTVHSYTTLPPSQQAQRLSWYDSRNGQPSLPRFSKFLPYVPTRPGVFESIQPRGTAMQSPGEASPSYIRREPSSNPRFVKQGSPSFEEELRHRLDERRAQIEQRIS